MTVAIAIAVALIAVSVPIVVSMALVSLATSLIRKRAAQATLLSARRGSWVALSLSVAAPMSVGITLSRLASSIPMAMPMGLRTSGAEVASQIL